MSYVNFDYFVERADILSEMAGGRPSTLPGIANPTSELLTAYKGLRNFLKSEYGIANSSSIDVFAFRYIYYIIEDYLSDQEQEAWNDIPKQQSPVKILATKYLNKVLQTNPEAIPEIINDLTDPDKIRQFKIYAQQTSKNQSRTSGKSREFADTTGLDRVSFMQMTAILEPLIKQMNTMMGSRKTSLGRSGEKSKYAIKTTESVDPNIKTATDISTILSEISAFREKLRASGDLDDKEEVSMWASKDPSSKLKQSMKGISDNIFDAYIGNLMTTIDAKIEAGTGQTLTGFLKLVNSIKQQPSSPKPIIELFDYIVKKIESNSVEDIYQTQEDEKQFEGYDEDVINKVLQTSDQKEMFGEWLSAHKKEREALDAELTRRYEDKISDLMMRLKGNDVKQSTASSGNQQTIIFAKEKEIERKQASGEDVSKDLIDLSKMKKRLEYIDTSDNIPKSQKNPWNRKISDIDQKIQFAHEELQTENDPSRIRELKQIISRLSSQLEIFNQKASDWEPVQESVLSYMEEQSQRDNKFGSQRGQFVDRGYKKITNYGQWLMLND